MASARQLAANHKNAQRSTGPKTPEGKAKSKFNGLKHGLTAATVVLPYEDQIAYHELRAQILEDFTPADAMEWMLVDQLASAWWRTIRARKVEGALMDAHTKTLMRKNEIEELEGEEENFGALGVAMACHPEATFKNYHRYDSSIDRAFYRAYDRLQKIKDKRNREQQRQAPPPPAAAIIDECPEMGLASNGRTAAAGHAASSAHASPSQPSSAASIVISAFNSLEMGQPDLAACAALSNLAASAPGILARTTR